MENFKNYTADAVLSNIAYQYDYYMTNNDVKMGITIFIGSYFIAYLIGKIIRVIVYIITPFHISNADYFYKKLKQKNKNTKM